MVKLASNENPLTPHEVILAAIAKESPRIHRYPGGGCRWLALRLANFMGCRAQELILMICLTFVDEGGACVLVAHTFDAYETGVRIMGGRLVFPPLSCCAPFPRAYGLAGIRIGYALAHPTMIEALHRVHLPFNINRLAEMAALKQQGWIHRRCRIVSEEKALLDASLREMGIFFVPSETNFVFMDVGVDADRLCEGLLTEGIIVCPGTIWGFPTFLSLTVGTRRGNERFLARLKARMLPRPAL